MGLDDELVRILSGMAAASPDELCGMVYGQTLFLIENVSESPANSFVMDGEQQAGVMSAHGRMPDYIWHTHPGGLFDLSPHDREVLPYDCGLIVAVPDGRVGVWRNGELEWQSKAAV